MKKKFFLAVLVFCGTLIGCPRGSFFLWAQDPSEPADSMRYALTSAVMCEGIQEEIPLNPTIVFSVGHGNAYCWSAFDQIAQKEIIYHFWYRKDRLVASIKLVLQPPRWATYSSIRLRDADKGPWRVDITDSDNHVLKTLRFSISD
ncbi:MAG: DUF2914 domain-containing protein [Desulfobacterales bacterium]|nr:DUF2914 domain-containing protein [Desulfobacterales bacterium]